MAIRINTFAEPLSPNSLRGGIPRLIESDASRLLTQELRRYCTGDVNGRSFLISGHRGAGKTTMVASAFLTVLGESRQKPQDLLRPLFVPLHGPNLLPDPNRAQPTKAEDSRAPVNAVDKDKKTGTPAAIAPSAKDLARDETDPETQAALVQITLALHRAVCRQMAESYRAHLLRIDPAGHPDMELAAQLELELYQWPTAMRLREFWRLAGVLHTGVLSYRRGPDQGLQELVALSAMCDSYRRISGTLSQTEKGSDSRSLQSDASLGVNAAGKDLFGPLISVLTGGIVGTGLATAGVPATAATFAGAVGALASAVTFKGSASRSRTRTRSREDNFLFDLSVTTLDRVLPMLIDALLRCGLAPMFVVDELDKVVDLQRRMIGMVHHLKKFVAERAFFCFLTDRLYFEQLRQLSHAEAFPSEYTYFTHRLFVVFRPSDMHTYLRQDVFGDPTQPQQPPPGQQAQAIAAAAPTPGGNTPDDQDRQLLPFIVLHRARMHPIDMQREVALLRSETGELNLPVGHVRSSPVFGFDVLMQVAIETVLRGRRIADELERDPGLYRVAYDSLYYLSRLWTEKGSESVDLRDDNLMAFEGYLDARVGREDPTRSTPNPDVKRLELPVTQMRLLFACVQELAHLLSDSEVCRRHLDPAVIPAHVFATVTRLLAQDPPLLERTGKDVFEWCYDVAGKRLRVPKQGDRSENWENDARSIEGVDATLQKLLGAAIRLEGMSSRFGVIAASPAWPQVEQAIARLRRFDGLQYPERPEDGRVVAEYATMLEQRIRTLGLSLLCAAAIGPMSRAKGRQAQLLQGLRILSEFYGLQFRVDFQVAQDLDQCWSSLRAEYGFTAADPPTTPDGFARVKNDTALLDIDGVLAEASTHSVTVSQIAKAWESLARSLANPSPTPVRDISELICSAAQVGPDRHLRKAAANPVALFSDLLAASLDDAVQTDEDRVPSWMAPVTLTELGFRAGSGRSFIAPMPSSELFKVRKAEPVPDFLESFTLGIPTPAAALILKTATNSLVNRLSWTRSVAAIALTQKQLQQPPLVGYLANVQEAFHGPLFQQLVIEMPTDLARAEASTEPVISHPSRPPLAVPRLFMYATQPSEDAPGPQLIAPTTLDQILPAAT